MRRLLFGLAAALFAVVPARAASDFQFWFGQSAKTHLGGPWGADVYQEVRWTDNAREFTHYEIEAGAIYAATSWLDLSVFYHQEYEKKAGDWLEENRPFLNATLKWEWLGFNFTDRNRLERRFLERAPDETRYRNLLTMIAPLKWMRWEVRPFVADEIYVRLNDSEFNRNRTYVGLLAKPTPHTRAEIYGLWQADKKRNDWPITQVIGAQVSFLF